MQTPIGTRVQPVNIRDLVVWVGGTLLPDLRDLAQMVLGDHPADPVVLHRLAEALTWGEIESDEFCRALSAAAGAPIARDEIARCIAAASAPQPHMIELLRTLALRLPLRFISDYPRPWLAQIAEQQGLEGLVDAPRSLYTAELRAGGELCCDALIAAGFLTPGSTLWVDRSTTRALALLRRGIDVALCGDALRLTRDLVLWGLLSPP